MSFCARTMQHKLTPLTLYLQCCLLFCMNFNVFSPAYYLRDYLHYEASTTASTSSPKHHFRTKLPAASTLKKQNEYKGK